MLVSSFFWLGESFYFETCCVSCLGKLGRKIRWVGELRLGRRIRNGSDIFFNETLIFWLRFHKCMKRVMSVYTKHTLRNNYKIYRLRVISAVQI